MSAKWQRITLSIPEEYGPKERQAIAQEAIDLIRERTVSKNVDKKGRAFPGYSKSYLESLEFKIAGKSKGSVDLTLSGDMLGALDLLSHGKGKVQIGYEKGSDINGRADGNIRGTYGSATPNPKKARDFLGLSDREMAEILKRYPISDRAKRQERAATVLEAASGAREIAGGIEADDGEE